MVGLREQVIGSVYNNEKKQTENEKLENVTKAIITLYRKGRQQVFLSFDFFNAVFIGKTWKNEKFFIFVACFIRFDKALAR